MSVQFDYKIPIPNGRVDAPVVVVGDAPSTEELSADMSFVGDTYDLMMDLLVESGFKEKDVVFVNCVSFSKLTRRNKLTADDIIPDATDNLIPFIAEYPRKLVLALGNNALCAIGAAKKPDGINAARSKVLESTALRDAGVDCPITASIHPYFVLKEPDQADDLIMDLRYANRLMKEGRFDQAPMVIRDIETIADVEYLLKEFRLNKYVAYDFETTGVNTLPGGDFPVTLSFCNGLKDNDGRYIVWFWAGYDRLKARYDRKTMTAFKDAFRKLFRRSGIDFHLIAWNQGFDDWMKESWLEEKFELSEYDGMLMKYTVNTKRPHDLKTATAYYLGYPNYDRPVDESNKEVKARRQKILSNPDDIFTLQYFGYEPKKTKTGVKWPEDLYDVAEDGTKTLTFKAPDKGLAMFALQPWDTLRTYNSYDALYTWLLFDKLGGIIEEENLVDSCDLRHRLAKELLRCEQRGMQLNVELNREYSKELASIEEICKKKILDHLYDLGIDMPDFNPNSGDQLCKVLYGTPVALPMFDAGKLSVDMGWDYAVAVDRCQIVEQHIYGENLEHVRQAYKLGLGFDAKLAHLQLATEFKRRFKGTPEIYNENVYLNGLYEPIAFTKSGKPSTAGSVLQTLYAIKEHDFLKLLLMLRRANKLRGTFVDGVYKRMDKYGVLRSHFNSVGTETGRISSSNPNGQNFQKSVRGMLIPRPGYKFLEWDLSQAEVRAVAAAAGDKALISALLEADSGKSFDLHTLIASMVFNIPPEKVDKETHRKYAKTIVFGIIYGMSAFRLSMQINVSVEKAQEFIDLFFSRFPDLKKWLDRQVRNAHKAPYYVYTPWGTRRSTRNCLSGDKKTVAHTERIATNMPIQGAAGELTLFYICEIMDRVRDAGYDCWLVNTTHDSCTLEVAEDLVWCELDGKVSDYNVKNKKGDVISTVCGPIADIIRSVIKDRSKLPSPLDTVSFVADLECNPWWSAEPNLKKALDPSKEFDWTWIKPDQIYDERKKEEKEILDEMREVELVSTGKVANY